MLKLLLISLFLQAAPSPQKPANLSDATLKDWYKASALSAIHYANYLEQQNKDRDALVMMKQKMSAECANLKMVLRDTGEQPTCVEAPSPPPTEKKP